MQYISISLNTYQGEENTEWNVRRLAHVWYVYIYKYIFQVHKTELLFV